MSLEPLARACAPASSAARSGESTSTTPPPLPRPPICTCTLTTDRPPSSTVAAAASSGVRRDDAARRGDPLRAEDVLALVLVEIHVPPRVSVRRVTVEPLAEPAADVDGGGARREDLLDAGALELRDVVGRDDPAAEHQDLAGAALAELLDDPREERHVRARVARQPDRVGVLLDRGLGDLLGRLVQAGVDDLEPRVAERAGHHLGAAVVPVEPGLRDDHSIRLGHRTASLTNAQVAALASDGEDACHGRHRQARGKVAVITGAGSGMGREACLVFAAEGARVVAIDLDGAALATTASIVGDDGDIAVFEADVSDEAAVREAIRAAVERFGELHVLYNNAGVLWRDRDLGVLETDEAIWDRVMAINLKGMVWICKYGIPELIRAGGGAVVNIGSVSALLGDTVPQDAYTASKGAVISLTRSLAVQFAAQGVRANCIHPGFVETPMQTVRTSDPAWVEGARAAIPLGRLGTPRDVVNAALFLASDEASYITGAELVVDGGTMVV